MNESYLVMIKRILISVFGVFFFAQSSLIAQNVYKIDKSKIQAEINKLTKLKSLDLGFCLFSPKGELIISYNGNQNLIPASTLKIFTTGAAINLLGRNFKYETQIQHDGFIDNCGVLYGNIFINGSGDPSLGTDRFPGNPSYGELINAFSDEIKKFGITEIKGNIIGNNSAFFECLTPESWPLDDQANYYGAAPNGLTINENSYKLFFKPGKTVGSSTEIIGTDPAEIPGLILKNNVTTYRQGSGDRAVIMEDPFHQTKEIVGTIPAGVKSFYIKGSVPDPASLTASLLLKSLKGRGIKVNGRFTSIYHSEQNNYLPFRNTIYTHVSPPLIDIITQVNMRSHNLFAETLIITLGKVFGGIGGQEQGLEAAFQYWDSKGIDIEKADIFDGCGLSPLNKISADILAKMLFSISQDSSFNDFLGTLPISGTSGTLKNFCKNSPAEGRIFAKSGYIEGVRSYAGYALSKSGNYFPFALIINGYEGSYSSLTHSLEGIMELMTNIQ